MSANDLTRCSTLLQLFLAIVLRAAVAAAAVELRLFDDLGMAEKKQEPKKRRFLKKNGMFHVTIALDMPWHVLLCDRGCREDSREG